jgi:hypothetical protein
MTSLQLYYINILFFLSFLYNREYKIINIKMQYSTIQEAYNIDSLKPTKKSTKTASQSSNNSQPYNIENNSVASNKEPVNYNSKGSSCSPIQAPTYNIPISGDCKKERDAAMKTYIEENFNAESANSGNSGNGGNGGNGGNSGSGTSPSAGIGNGGENRSTNSGNILTNRQDNIMPFYDEDMEQYFDINNLTDEVSYKSNDGTKVYNYMPNHNRNSYTNNNTGEYSNSNNVSKNGVNLLNTAEYNLSAEERKKAQEALEYLKSIEYKINNDENRAANETLDKVRRSNDTGPGGFGKATFENNKNIENEKKATAAIQTNNENENKLLESIKENKKTENIFNMIINIFIFVFIGAFIILICDYITELAIQIGSTKTSNVLEPYIKYNIYMQHHFQHLQNMQNMQNMQMPNMPMPNMPMQNMPMQNMQIPNMPMSQNQGFPYNIPDMPSPIGIAK